MRVFLPPCGRCYVSPLRTLLVVRKESSARGFTDRKPGREWMRMELFNIFRRRPQPVPIDIADVRRRAQSIHDRVNGRSVEVSDLFAMIGEDDRPRRLHPEIQSIDDIVRVLPSDVPSLSQEPAVAEYSWRAHEFDKG